jgi:hypothetical protein
MTGENIICFAKDWNEDPTSNNHVMRQLARRNRVLWMNSIATRTPSLASGRDLGKLRRKLASSLHGAKQVSENLWVYTPIVVPLPHSRLATALNSCILRATLRVLRRKLGMKEFQLWTFLPKVADYVGRLGESLVVYYCVDEWSKFSYVDGPKIAAAERRLCERAAAQISGEGSEWSHRLCPTAGGHSPGHLPVCAPPGAAVPGKSVWIGFSFPSVSPCW